MSEELHPLAELMLARMKSHPEEFTEEISNTHVASGYRWDNALSALLSCGSEADKAAVRAGLNEVRLAAAHEWALDELLNGEDRRNVAELAAHNRIGATSGTALSLSALISAQQTAISQQVATELAQPSLPYMAKPPSTTSATELIRKILKPGGLP